VGGLAGAYWWPSIKIRKLRFSPQRCDGRVSDERVQAIGASRMDERHAHLDQMLGPK